jgi:sugar lactone lactonase YvrE
MGIAIDAGGNVFIAGASRIRKITAAGVISTVAGSDARGFSGDGAQATSTELINPNAVTVDAAGNLFISDSGNHRIRKVTFAP